MLPPINTFGAASLAFTLVLACGTADSTRRASGGSSSANPDAAPAATPVAARSAQTPTDSISARADRGRIQGNADAKLWIIEASDFQCPFCKTWHDSAYGLVIRDYVKTGKTRMAYLNFPLTQHKNAMPAAEAAMCASVQDKFWPMHDALFTTQQQWEALPNPSAAFDSMAAHLSVDMSAWRECVTKHLTRPLIDADYSRSQAAGVKSTPSFFIGDQQLAGVDSYAYFRQIVEAQLAKVGAGTGARR